MVTVIAGGSPAAGKTSMLKHVIRYLLQQDCRPAVCKIDCMKSNDRLEYQALGIPVVQGLSADICPDHFLATNMIDIFQWGLERNATHLFIETAGLCNRCAPFTDRSLNLCAIDSIGSIKGPEKLGPLVSTADVLVVLKSDLISQAEREVLAYHLSTLNANAFLLELNGLSGFGAQRLGQLILEQGRPMESLEEARLCHPMPAANCAYCVGEIRIGRCYQQGMLSRMRFDAEEAGDAC